MDTIRKRIVWIALVLLLLPVLTSFNPVATKPKKAKNVILMIGDGMGIAHMYAAWTFNKGMLNMTTFPYTGLSLTYSADNYITDSAAGATALSTGQKTNNGFIAVDTSKKKLKTILEIAEDNGLSTGLVSTSAITHATPASFIAHQPSRNLYEDIAADFLKTDIEVFIGGGADHFNKRKDGRDLTKELAAKGYQLAFSTDEFKKVKSGKLCAWTAPEHNPYFRDGRGDMLPAATQKAISLLAPNSKGFFLMVEGSMIDFANHARNDDNAIAETVDFDKAVGVALEFARKDGNTLVIVLADHESGGMALVGGNIAKGEVEADFETFEHTAVPVPVYAFGPGAEMFTGVYENNTVFNKMLHAYGISK